MTTPTPAPTPNVNQQQANAAAGQFGLSGLNLTPGGASGKNLYGLTALVAGTPVHGAGNLFPIPTGPDGTATAADVAKAFATLTDRATIAKLQDLLYKAGAYGDPSTTKAPTYGSLGPDDVSAFNDLLKNAAQTGSDIGTLLKSRAVAGQTQGIQAVVNKINAQPRAQIAQENPDKLAKTIDAEYVAILGHKPSPSERAGFIVAYNHAYAAFQQKAIDAQAAASNTSVAQDNISSAPPNPATTPDPASPGNLRLFEEQASGDVPGPLDAAGVQERINEGTRIARGPNPLAPPDFDPASFTENYVRNQHPDEAGAHDLTGQFSTFLSLLGGIK